MDRIDLAHRLRFLRRLDVEIDHHRLAVAADHDAFEQFVAAGVELLVRHIGRHKDEIAGTGLGREFEMLAARDHSDAVVFPMRRVVMIVAFARCLTPWRDEASKKLNGQPFKRKDIF